MSPQAVADLDNLIKSGVIRANYKFGEPDMASSGLDRHDAVTIYFLEEPSEDALAQISAITQRNFRGNDLMGKKVSEGFYMSEIGSISEQQALDCIESISALDPELGTTARDFLTVKGATDRIAMSEAQFYSLQETLNLFGHNLTYNPEKGIAVT